MGSSYLLLFLLSMARGQIAADRLRLKTDLFTGLYDKTVKPEGQVTVQVSVAPKRLDLFAEDEVLLLERLFPSGLPFYNFLFQILSIMSFNSYTWSDPRLQWDPSDYGNVKKLYLPQDMVKCFAVLEEDFGEFGILLSFSK